jgi:hypothetical protein
MSRALVPIVVINSFKSSGSGRVIGVSFVDDDVDVDDTLEFDEVDFRNQIAFVPIATADQGTTFRWDLRSTSVFWPANSRELAQSTASATEASSSSSSSSPTPAQSSFSFTITDSLMTEVTRAENCSLVLGAAISAITRKQNELTVLTNHQIPPTLDYILKLFGWVETSRTSDSTVSYRVVSDDNVVFSMGILLKSVLSGKIARECLGVQVHPKALELATAMKQASECKGRTANTVADRLLSLRLYNRQWELQRKAQAKAKATPAGQGVCVCCAVCVISCEVLLLAAARSRSSTTSSSMRIPASAEYRKNQKQEADQFDVMLEAAIEHDPGDVAELLKLTCSTVPASMAELRAIIDKVARTVKNSVILNLRTVLQTEEADNKFIVDSDSDDISEDCVDDEDADNIIGESEMNHHTPDIIDDSCIIDEPVQPAPEAKISEFNGLQATAVPSSPTRYDQLEKVVQGLQLQIEKIANSPESAFVPQEEWDEKQTQWYKSLQKENRRIVNMPPSATAINRARAFEITMAAYLESKKLR